MTSLTVLGLSYDPPVNVLAAAEEYSRQYKEQYLPKRIADRLPHVPFGSSRYAPLHNISFRANSGDVTAILSKDIAERRTIVELIINRRFSGSFNGDVIIDGARVGSSFDDNIAFVHRKCVFVPGLTYHQLLMYAARLRIKSFNYARVVKRVDEVMRIMDLVHCRNRKIEESPSFRGAAGGELRRLSMACEIVSLPPILVFDEPTLSLEPGIAYGIITCLHALATRGHTVVCTMASISPQLLPLINQVVVVSSGYSVFAASPNTIESYYCSKEMGYIKRGDIPVMAFVQDIAVGIERSSLARVPDSPLMLHLKFESSSLCTHSQRRTKSETPPLRGLPDSSHIQATYRAIVDLPSKLNTNGLRKICRDFLFWLMRVYLVVERALFVKATDTVLLVRGFGAAIFVGSVIGYLQYNCGNFGYYAMTLVGFPYVGTANTTAVLFFISAFTIAQQVLNVQLVCQSLQMFRYEQFTGVCPTFGYVLGAALADIPIVFANTVVFATIVYFLTQMNYGYDNWKFFVETLGMNALIGQVTAHLLAVLLRREIPVRDMYLTFVFIMLILSGFPFQLPYIRSYMADISQVNPMRWTFEALMNWKFGGKYADGHAYLVPFSFATFDNYEVFNIQSTFLLISSFTIFAFLLPRPSWLHRARGGNGRAYDPEDEEEDEDGARVGSLDSDFGVDSSLIAGDIAKKLPPSRLSETGGRASEASLPSRKSEGGLTSRKSEGGTSLHRPLLFNRETSITAKSQLSINIHSQSSIHNSITGVTAEGDGVLHTVHGPTVEFRNLCYSVKDAFAPLGVKTILQNVSGKFDWGKLSMILGATMSGRSSLLHILAGDIGSTSEVRGDILFDGQPVNKQLPLWQRCAFVEAHDEQYRDITVKDAITYAMKLRCPSRAFYDIVESNVAKTIQVLHLDEAANKKTKFISRGERRRLSIAEEIVSGPSLLLIDEPTTDLDVHDESVMMQCFREMVNQDRTVLASMHHPSEQVFHLFDTVLLLSQGRVIFFGDVADAVPYFTSMPNPYAIGQLKNPADFLTDISGGYIANCRGELLASAVLAEYYQDDLIKKARAAVTPTGTTSYSVVPSNTMNRGKSIPVVVGGSAGGVGNSGRGSNVGVADGVASNSGKKSAVTGPQVDDLDKRAVDTLSPTFSPLNELSGFVDTRDNSSDMSIGVGYTPFSSRAALTAFLCPACITSVATSVSDYFTSFCNTNWSTTFLVIEIIVTRSFLSLWFRKKLILAALVLHVLMACFLGWVLGPSGDQIYNLTSFFAIGTLLLYFANIQLVYYMFTSHQVFLKEHSRGLYSTLLYWMFSQWPIYLLKACCAVVFAVISFALLAMGLDEGIRGFFILNTICSVLAGQMVAEWVVFMISEIRAGYMILPVLYFTFFAFSGLFLKPCSLPAWISCWAPSYSIIRWAMQASFINYFDGSPLFPVALGIDTYTQFLALFGWGGKTKWYCMYMLLAQISVYKTLSLFSAGFSAINQRGMRSMARPGKGNRN